MAGPPPTSTLFPYTTLFRSVVALPAHRWRVGPVPAGSLYIQHLPPLSPRRGGADRQLSGDRKSTRLNSSHVEISYAVFCLKKKKKISYLSYYSSIHTS